MLFRSVAAQSERRLEECAKLGVAAVVAPAGTRTRSKLFLTEVETLRAAVRAALDAPASENPRK